jgi:hypothetical protein
MSYGPSTIRLSGGSSDSASISNPQATPQQMLALYNQYLPATLATTTNQVPAVSNELAGAAAGSNPIYTASGLNQLNQYAPGYQQAGANLSTQQALSQADLLSGAGGLYALEGAGLTNLLNPAQAASNTQAANLVNSINLNGLSGGETAAVDRSLNQSNYATGNLGLDNATNAVQNAMQFGNALQAKRAALGTALGQATGVAQAQNTAFNPVQAATSAGNVSANFGLGQFNPTQANANLTTPFTFATGLGNQLAGVSSASQTRSGSSSAQGGVSCYLTTACCEFMGLPDDCEELEVLRAFRDKFVPKEVVNEYYKVAPEIVNRIKNDRNKLMYVYKVVRSCVLDIKSGRNSVALLKYFHMVQELKG